MKIFEIIQDIFDDMDIREKRLRDSAPFDSPWRRTPSWRRKSRNASFLLTILPNIAGFIVGCAVTKFLTLSGIFYIIFGVIFAVAGGTYYSVTKEGISLKYAIIRHCIIVGFICAIFAFIVLTDDKK